MKFAKIVFFIAGICGVLVLPPLLFIYDLIGREDPPSITHPALQVAFLVIAKDPVRFRPLIIPSILEKFGYGAALIILFLQQRLHASDLTFGVVDVLLVVHRGGGCLRHVHDPVTRHA